MTDAAAPPQTVLVVDDEKNVRLILRQALEDLGLDVETAADGPEALEKIDDTDYDLILLDLRMPGPDGLEVLQQTRQQAPDLPVVIVTAHGTVENAVQAMRRGAVDVLLKPISLDSLRDLVDRVLQRPAVEGTATPYDEWIRLATWHVRHRRTQAARNCLREAIDQDDGRPEAHTLLGILEETSGNIDAARQHLEAAVERGPDAATAQLLLDCLQEGAAFPVDQPGALTDAVTSEADATAEMRPVSPEPSSSEEDLPHRVLAVLPERIANGATAGDRALTQLAASSARAHTNGELLLLSVVEVPRQLALSQAEEANQERIQEVQWQLEALAEEMTGDTLQVRPMVVVAHLTVSVLENVIPKQSVQHLVGPWPGTDGADSNEDPGWTDALADVSCEVTLLRAPSDVATSNGTDVTAFVSDSPYAPFVARRALEWAQGSGVASLTLLTIQADDGTASNEDLRYRGQRLLWDVADRAGLAEEQYEGRVLVSKDVNTAAERCAGACDRICVGASRGSTGADSAFGSFPERLVTSSECPVALVRGPKPGRRSVLEDLGRRLMGA
jgi:DNA-binding response OmpR family regulator/nucleotide-binding universal stress UspA family protein